MFRTRLQTRYPIMNMIFFKRTKIVLASSDKMGNLTRSLMRHLSEQERWSAEELRDKLPYLYEIDSVNSMGTAHVWHDRALSRNDPKRVAARAKKRAQKELERAAEREKAELEKKKGRKRGREEEKKETANITKDDDDDDDPDENAASINMTPEMAIRTKNLWNSRNFEKKLAMQLPAKVRFLSPKYLANKASFVFPAAANENPLGSPDSLIIDRATNNMDLMTSLEKEKFDLEMSGLIGNVEAAAEKTFDHLKYEETFLAAHALDDLTAMNYIALSYEDEDLLDDESLLNEIFNINGGSSSRNRNNINNSGASKSARQYSKNLRICKKVIFGGTVSGHLCVWETTKPVLGLGSGPGTNNAADPHLFASPKEYVFGSAGAIVDIATLESYIL